MRLFIAVEMPEELSEKINEIKRRIPTKGLKLTRDNHITLKFLGEVPESRVGEITSRLKEIIFSPIKIKTLYIDAFPNMNKPRVIHLKCDSPQLIELAKNISNKLKEYPHDKPFVPHITLARVKFLKDKPELKEKIKDIKVVQEEFAINSFCLKQSVLKPDGPEYKNIEVFEAK
jgi:2'-5' RNA ligase